VIADCSVGGLLCRVNAIATAAFLLHAPLPDVDDFPMRASDTLLVNGSPRCVNGDWQREDVALGEVRELERFLAGVEQRAFRIARIALRNDDDALDAVQDAMLQLAQRYGQRPSEEWRPLFYRILQNRVRDQQRRRQVRNRVFAWFPTFGGKDDADNDSDPMELVGDQRAGIVEQLATGEAMKILEGALAALPARQQEAFMLRNFEGLDVAQTAIAMGCSEGSVKTHYSRAVHSLRAQIGEAW